MQQTLRIASVNSGHALELTLDGEDLVARLTGPTVQASVRAWLYEGPSSFVSFFESMASESYGWTDTKVWAAIEDDLKLEASVDRAGHVTIAVCMRCAEQADPWALNISLDTELGQLPEIAKQARRSFASNA